MIPNTAEMFREGKAELLKLFGNKYLVYNAQGVLLTQTFRGLISIRNYKDFQRRLLSTLDDVSYIQDGFLVAHHKEPENKMRVWGKDNHYVQDQLVSTTIYLTNSDDPVQRISMSVLP